MKGEVHVKDMGSSYSGGTSKLGMGMMGFTFVLLLTMMGLLFWDRRKIEKIEEKVEVIEEKKE